MGDGGGGDRKVDGRGEEERVEFRCSICSLTESCDYFGRSPPFAKKQLEFKSDTYVIRDPFGGGGGGRGKPAQFLVVGGACESCGSNVCVECSTFYFKRICDSCAARNLAEFPPEVGAKIQKKLDARK